jgi:hypothetical protein
MPELEDLRSLMAREQTNEGASTNKDKSQRGRKGELGSTQVSDGNNKEDDQGCQMGVQKPNPLMQKHLTSIYKNPQIMENIKLVKKTAKRFSQCNYFLIPDLLFINCIQ